MVVVLIILICSLLTYRKGSNKMKERQLYLFDEVEQEKEAVIYESPDGGETIYARKNGEADRVKITKLPDKDTHGYYKHA